MMIMKASMWAAGAFLLAAAPANAAPTVGQGLADARPAAAAEKATYYRRRCWRHRGVRVCRRYAPYAYYNDWGPSYGFGPSLGFYFGGGGHRGWHGGGRHRGGGHFHGGHHR